ETAVELDDFGGAIRRDHQARIQEAGVGVAFSRHALHRGVDHLVHNTLVHFGGNHRCRGVGAHAAGIGAGVIVADPFVVLAGGHGQDVLAVHHDDEAGFLAFQELFDHHPMAGGTKGIAGQHILDRLFRFLLGHGHDDAFAVRLAAGLVARGRTCLPSTMAMKLAASPAGNSSITTRWPAAPQALPASRSLAASSASCWVMATMTPLPAARPSALTTMGAPFSRM